MTFDDAGGSYWGPVAEVNGDVLTTAADCKATTEEWGGWVGGSIIVLNGTGAGQWRRIVVAGVYTDPNVTTNRTWVVDSPFAVTPDATSFIEIMPFRCACPGRHANAPEGQDVSAMPQRSTILFSTGAATCLHAIAMRTRGRSSSMGTRSATSLPRTPWPEDRAS